MSYRLQHVLPHGEWNSLLMASGGLETCRLAVYSELPWHFAPQVSERCVPPEPTGPLTTSLPAQDRLEVACPAPVAARFPPPTSKIRFPDKPLFFIASMPNNLSDIRRFNVKQKTKPRQVTTDPQMDLVCSVSLPIDPLNRQTRKQSQESSPDLIPEIASTPRASSDLGRLARWQNLLPFNRSNRSIPSSSLGVSASV